MKSILLPFFLSIAFVVNAQFTMSRVSDGSPIVNEQQITVNSTSSSVGKINFHINNTGANPIRVWTEIVSFTGSNGAMFQFCLQGECFFDASVGLNVPSQPFSIPAGQNQGNFDYFWNQNTSASPISYRLKFFQVDASNNEIGTPIFVNYTYDVTASEELFAQLKDLKILNTIVSAELRINSPLELDGVVYDLMGRKISSHQLIAGNNTLSIDALTAGTYLINFSTRDGQRLTKKFIVR
jgi:hypothetical protein